MRLEEVHRPPPARVLFGERDRRPAGRRVEFPGEVQQAVPDHLRLHPHRVHPPQVTVLGVESHVPVRVERRR